MADADLEAPESDETLSDQVEDGGEEPELDEDTGEPKKKPVDWEKQAHDKAGLAAKERSRRRAVERELGDLRNRFSGLEAKVNGAQPDELALLVNSLRDDDDEPITDINQIKRVLKTFLKQQDIEQRQQSEQQQRLAATHGLVQTMNSAEADFAEDHPDYYKAAEYVRETRKAELEDMGYTGQQLQSRLANELFGMTADLINGGRDPAEAVYNLAKRRGFQSGRAAADDRLKKLQAGATAANGAALRGKGADNGLSWDSVARLKGAARDAAWQKLRNRELGKD